MSAFRTFCTHSKPEAIVKTEAFLWVYVKKRGGGGAVTEHFCEIFFSELCIYYGFLLYLHFLILSNTERQQIFRNIWEIYNLKMHLKNKIYYSGWNKGSTTRHISHYLGWNKGSTTRHISHYSGWNKGSTTRHISHYSGWNKGSTTRHISHYLGWNKGSTLRHISHYSGWNKGSTI